MGISLYIIHVPSVNSGSSRAQQACRRVHLNNVYNSIDLQQLEHKLFQFHFVSKASDNFVDLEVLNSIYIIIVE